MLCCLFRCLLICILSVCFLTSYGQDLIIGRPNDVRNRYQVDSARYYALKNMSEPLYLLNSTTIINGSLNSIKPSDIKTIVVYKGGQEGPKELKNIGFRGIVDITSKKSVKGKPLAKVAAKQRLKGPVAFVLNGNRLDAAHVAALRIIPEAVGQIHVTPASVENPETIVSIRLAVAKAAEVPSDGKLRIMIR